MSDPVNSSPVIDPIDVSDAELSSLTGASLLASPGRTRSKSLFGALPFPNHGDSEDREQFKGCLTSCAPSRPPGSQSLKQNPDFSTSGGQADLSSSQLLSPSEANSSSQKESSFFSERRHSTTANTSFSSPGREASDHMVKSAFFGDLDNLQHGPLESTPKKSRVREPVRKELSMGSVNELIESGLDSSLSTSSRSLENRRVKSSGQQVRFVVFLTDTAPR